MTKSRPEKILCQFSALLFHFDFSLFSIASQSLYSIISDMSFVLQHLQYVTRTAVLLLGRCTDMKLVTMVQLFLELRNVFGRHYLGRFSAASLPLDGSAYLTCQPNVVNGSLQNPFLDEVVNNKLLDSFVMPIVEIYSAFANLFLFWSHNFRLTGHTCVNYTLIGSVQYILDIDGRLSVVGHH